MLEVSPWRVIPATSGAEAFQGIYSYQVPIYNIWVESKSWIKYQSRGIMQSMELNYRPSDYKYMLLIWISATCKDVSMM